jgi:DNA-binding MarR family transcriptional regulator
MNDQNAQNEEIMLLLRYLVRSGKAIESKIHTQLGDIGLTCTKMMALQELEDTHQPLSLSQLASSLAFVKSNATQLVDNLESDNMVRRVPDPDDRRYTLLEVTEEGKQRCQSGLEMLQPLTQKLEVLYTPEERTQLLNLLRRLQDGLN